MPLIEFVRASERSTSTRFYVGVVVACGLGIAAFAMLPV